MLTGVRVAWEKIAGPDLGVLSPFLRLKPEPATVYPCPEPDADGCPRAVVVHGPGEIVAVCRASPRRCETITLKKSDLAIYELDLSNLGARLSTHFGFKGERGAVGADGLPRTAYLGAYSPVAGRTFPAYLTIQHDTDDLAAMVERLIARNARPFILFTPTMSFVAPSTSEAIRARDSLLLALADIACAGSSGDLVIDRSGGEVLAPLREAALQQGEGRNGMVVFPTPPSATWEQVEIRFRDGHTVSVKVLGEEGVFNYTQMGMANRKNAEPTVQWKLLKSFAESRGAMTWKSSDADRKNQKRRENLAKDLRAFFRIDGDPIAATANGGWRVRFALHDG